jgi:integrase/recombinase XerD
MILSSVALASEGRLVTVDDLGRVIQFGGVRYLNPADQVLEEMLTGWRRQQLSRNLSIDTINGRERIVRRFLGYTNEMPWHWTHAHVDEYFGDLRAEKHRAQSTVRGYQNALGLFCAYLVDPVYGWGPRCEELFGTYPIQVCFEWNTAAHTQDNEHDPNKRAFTHEELQAFFDHADAEIGRVRELGRKGWLPALRDSVLFKTAYAFGLRNAEVRNLRTIDFERNPHAREFGHYGALEVRFGKAHKGSAPKRRTVLTVFDWSVEVIAHWVDHGLPRFQHAGLDLFPSERGTLVSETALNGRFCRYRQELGLDEALDMHSFRRSYATHLIEAGFDPLFVQKQLGHEHASTTAIYEFVSDDYRRAMLRDALNNNIADALARTRSYT